MRASGEGSRARYGTVTVLRRALIVKEGDHHIRGRHQEATDTECSHAMKMAAGGTREMMQQKKEARSEKRREERRLRSSVLTCFVLFLYVERF